MAQDEVVRIVTSPPPAPQAQQHGLSRAPSVVPSRPPTVPPKSPTPPTISHVDNATIQPVLSHVAIPDEPGTSNFQITSPSSQIAPVVIPPDNFIPLLGEDNRIRIPPAFEFTRSTSPVPPPQNHEEIRMIPPPASNTAHSMRTHRSASLASASPTISHLSMLANPLFNDRGTPMSVIPESQSQENSLGPADATPLQRQPSLVSPLRTQSSDCAHKSRPDSPSDRWALNLEGLSTLDLGQLLEALLCLCLANRLRQFRNLAVMPAHQWKVHPSA